MSEKGTLFQLRTLINRTSVPKKEPHKSMKATEDFFEVVLHGHILAAAQTILRSSSNLHSTTSLAKQIINAYVSIDVCDETPLSSDGIYVYACEVLTLLLVWHNFHDAVREGDGDRVFVIWKLLLLIFKATDKRNYAKEAAILLLQNRCFLSKRQSAQLVWSRFINTSGFIGCNIPTDLYMEHLNRRLKMMLKHSGSNVIQPNAIVRAGKSVGFVHHICSTFESECGLRHSQGQHRRCPFLKDLKLILSCLEENEIFIEKGNRYHPSFKIKKRVIQSHSKEEIESWLLNNILPTLIFL